MMKRIFTGLLAMAMVLSVSATGALAAGRGRCQNRTTVACQGSGYVDTDGDGICDNRQPASGAGCSRHFVDKNGDGICDNHSTARHPRGHQGRHHNR